MSHRCNMILSDVEKRYEIEVNTYQQRVNRLQSELDKANNDMKKHLAEYKNLMSVKQSLEKVTGSNEPEVILYCRKLIHIEPCSKEKKDDFQRLDQVTRGRH